MLGLGLNLPNSSSTGRSLSLSNSFTRAATISANVTSDGVGTLSSPRTATIAAVVTSAGVSTLANLRTSTSAAAVTSSGESTATRPRTASIAATVTSAGVGTVTAAGGGGDAPVIESSAQNTDFSYSSGDMIISKPSGTVSGDLLVVIISTNTNSGMSHATPSGWTMLVDNEVSRTGASATKNQFSVMYKVAGASEGSSYVFDLGTASTRRAGQIFRISGASSSLQAGTHTGSNGNTNTALSITTTVANTLVLLIYAHTGSQINDTTPNPTIGTIALNTEDPVANGGGQDIKTYEYVQTTAGAVGTETQKYTGSVDYSGIQIGIRPA